MARHKTWVNILSDLVRDNPRTSAMIAFNLGVWAGQATQKRLGKTDLSELPGKLVDLSDLPAKLVDLMPSMRELGDYVPALPSPMKGKPARRGARKTAGKRKAKRGAAKRKAA